MADAEDSKSSVRKHMRVQVPPSVPRFHLSEMEAKFRVRSSCGRHSCIAEMEERSWKFSDLRNGEGTSAASPVI